MSKSYISINVGGGFQKAPRYFRKLYDIQFRNILEKYGKQGVARLSEATPKDTGLAASKWRYEINISKNAASISFLNDDIENGFPVAIMLQYGHGTGTGGWVEGRDYINPALKPILDDIAVDVWEEVKTL